MIYLDSSAIVKLLRHEAETDALAAHLQANRHHEPVTSALATVEVARALTTLGATDTAARAIRRSDRIEAGDDTIPAVAMIAPVLDLARTLPPTVLRSLDAVHLATALLVGDALDHVITYDKRMVAAANAAGLRTASPS